MKVLVQVERMNAVKGLKRINYPNFTGLNRNGPSKQRRIKKTGNDRMKLI
jgi:hypothetical protein